MADFAEVAAALQSAKLYQDQSLICYFEHT